MTKRINQQNWLERDDSLRGLVTESETGMPGPMSEQEWLGLILKPQLLPSVPREVQRLYDGARGALAYGYFYYALCIMGMVALFRVAEAALSYKCKELDIEGSRGGLGANFDGDVEWLAARGVVQAGEWNAVSQGRNYMYHPESQQIITTLEEVTERINALFPPQSS